jgi:4-hydroxy-3-methylbut-2-enyl diphosphate reductase
LCEEKLPTYFISSEEKIYSSDTIIHFDTHFHKEKETHNYIPLKEKVDILLTSGASCPDAVVEAVLRKIHSFFPDAKDIDEVVSKFE